MSEDRKSKGLSQGGQSGKVSSAEKNDFAILVLLAPAFYFIGLYSFQLGNCNYDAPQQMLVLMIAMVGINLIMLIGGNIRQTFFPGKKIWHGIIPIVVSAVLVANIWIDRSPDAREIKRSVLVSIGAGAIVYFLFSVAFYLDVYLRIIFSKLDEDVGGRVSRIRLLFTLIATAVCGFLIGIEAKRPHEYRCLYSGEQGEYSQPSPRDNSSSVDKL